MHLKNPTSQSCKHTHTQNYRLARFKKALHNTRYIHGQYTHESVLNNNLHDKNLNYNTVWYQFPE